MKEKLTIIFVLLGGLLLPALAEAQSPTQIVQKLIVQMQSTHSVEPAVDHIDWEGAFQAMDPEMRKQMGINSAEDLKKRELKKYSGSGAEMSAAIQRGLAAPNKDAKQEYALNATRERLDKSLAAQQEQAKADFHETTYSIADSKIGDTEATVNLKKTRNGESTVSTLEFVKVGGEWKMKSAAALSPTASNVHNTSSDILGPSIASPNEAVLRIH